MYSPQPLCVLLCPLLLGNHFPKEHSLATQINIEHLGKLVLQWLSADAVHYQDSTHSDNPKVAEILRRKSKTLKKTVCKFCDKTLEGGMTGRATHMRESHCDESGNFKCPQCEMNYVGYPFLCIWFKILSFGDLEKLY